MLQRKCIRIRPQTEINNMVDLKQKVSEFKQHVLKLDKLYSHDPKGLTCPKTESKVNKRSTLFNKFEGKRMSSIEKGNSILVQKMINIEAQGSQYSQTQAGSLLSDCRRKYMLSKFRDRKRALTEIAKENQILSTKIARCKSSGKLQSHLNLPVSLSHQSIRRRFSNMCLDYRRMAEKEISKDRQKLKLGNKLQKVFQ